MMRRWMMLGLLLPAVTAACQTTQMRPIDEEFLRAAYKGDRTQVQALLENGADVNAARTDDGATPLLIAAQEGHREVVALLLEKGADVNLAAKNDWTPLHVATKMGHTAIAEMLRKKGG